MELFQSLICWQGNDNRQRFALINLACYLVFIITSSLFSQFPLLSYFCLFLLLAIHICTTQRRLNDAELKKNWLILPPAAFLLSGIIILSTYSPVWYWLILLPTFISALLLTYPSAPKKHYTLGYNGPIELTAYQSATVMQNKRIEPSLFTGEEAASASSAHIQHDNYEFEQATSSDVNKSDIGELIRLRLLSNQNALYSLIALASVILIAILISVMVSSKVDVKETDINQANNQPQTSKINTLAKHSPLLLPDNFTLLLSEYDGLIIQWQGDVSSQDEIWSQLSLIGDRSCENISFNKGNTVRSLMVRVENQSDYFAYFSPLDTQDLVKAIAYQSNFNLCGYEFSLKGSQATIGKHEIYGEYIAQ